MANERESLSVLFDSLRPHGLYSPVQSVEFSRPEYWSGQLFPSPGDLPNLGIEPVSRIADIRILHQLSHKGNP